MKENAPPETMTTPEGPGGGDRATSPGLPASALVTGVEGDRVRWGPVWTGALTTLSINVVLQLLFYALGWLDLGTENGTTASVVSAVLGLVAFLLGGFAAGASAGWRRAGRRHGERCSQLDVDGGAAVGPRSCGCRGGGRFVRLPGQRFGCSRAPGWGEPVSGRRRVDGTGFGAVGARQRARRRRRRATVATRWPAAHSPPLTVEGRARARPEWGRPRCTHRSRSAGDPLLMRTGTASCHTIGVCVPPGRL